MENKVYVILITQLDEDDNCREVSIGGVFYDKLLAESYAEQLENSYNTEYSIVPEDIFLSWPMDSICNSPIAHYKGYDFLDYEAQAKKCESYLSHCPVYCRVEEHTLS